LSIFQIRLKRPKYRGVRLVAGNLVRAQDMIDLLIHYQERILSQQDSPIDQELILKKLTAKPLSKEWGLLSCLEEPQSCQLEIALVN
jgi:hypothetical protein